MAADRLYGITMQEKLSLIHIFANLIIIGTPEDIGEHSKGLDVSGATIINPQTYEKTQEYIDLFVELRKSKGMTPEKAKETILGDYAYYGCLRCV